MRVIIRLARGKGGMQTVEIQGATDVSERGRDLVVAMPDGGERRFSLCEVASWGILSR